MGWHGLPVLLGAVPYAVLLPRIGKLLDFGKGDVEALKAAAKTNVRLHLLFSFLFILGLGLSLLIKGR
jgi:hypothetical protein